MGSGQKMRQMLFPIFDDPLSGIPDSGTDPVSLEEQGNYGRVCLGRRGRLPPHLLAGVAELDSIGFSNILTTLHIKN